MLAGSLGRGARGENEGSEIYFVHLRSGRGRRYLCCRITEARAREGYRRLRIHSALFRHQHCVWKRRAPARQRRGTGGVLTDPPSQDEIELAHGTERRYSRARLLLRRMALASSFYTVIGKYIFSLVACFADLVISFSSLLRSGHRTTASIFQCRQLAGKLSARIRFPIAASAGLIYWLS